MERSYFLIDMGKRIAERRKSLHLSQEELAELAEVSPQLLSTAERGTKGVRPENLMKLSNALGVSADYLLTGEIIDKDFSLIIKKLEHISADQIRTIEQILNYSVHLCMPYEKS